MDTIDGENVVTVGVPMETAAGERRVALTPEAVEQAIALGLGVVVQSGAGKGAYFDDEAYLLAGARIASQAEEVYRQAAIVTKVQPPDDAEVELMQPGTLLISFLDPARHAASAQALSARGITTFSFNRVPRTTRAQSMDAMSAMSTAAGYKAVLLAANALPRFFPLLMTAAGTTTPARVVVIGAGVAGLQALATARRLGAVTAACDARAAVKEQIESVGASFIDMSVPVTAEGEGGYARVLGEEIERLERDAIRSHIAGADVVISTAQVPGARAPLLVDEAMVREMRPGSVIIDLAAETGGNCELTVPDEVVSRYGVTIMGPTNLPSSLAVHSSQMYARTVTTVLKYVVKEGRLQLNFEDEILGAACVTRPAASTA